MKVKFINVGRSKVNKTIEVRNLGELEVEVEKCVVSRSMELVEVDETHYDVVVGMGSTVGQIEIVER